MQRVLLSALLLIPLLLPLSNHSVAEQRTDNNTSGGLNVTARLKHKIVVPAILFFSIGSVSQNDVDEVSFDVTPGAAPVGATSSYNQSQVPIGDGTILNANSNGTMPVSIMSNVGSVSLSYELSDPLGLVNADGDYIPFDEIKVQSSSAGLPAPVLSNSGGGAVGAVSITGNFYGGRVIKRQAQWTFQYLNTTATAAGEYQGQVRYTVAAP